MKGTIISIEGTDGAGKHTQQQLLAKTLKEQGYNVFEQSFPHYESDSSAPVKMYLGGEFGASANCLDAYQASTVVSSFFEGCILCRRPRKSLLRTRFCSACHSQEE